MTSDSERRAMRYAVWCAEAEALMCAAAALDRWGDLKAVARQLERAAEGFEAKASVELEKVIE